MVAKDTATGSQSVPINPLNLTTPEEKYLFSLGEKNIARRRKLALDSLFKVPPRQEENAIIHKVFVTTLDHDVRSFSARVKPENSEWMTDSKLKSVMMCEPKHRNDYNKVRCDLIALTKCLMIFLKVFGGLIMEKCMDLALTLTYNYTGCGPTPVCTHVDDVEFIKPVEIGDLMFFHSQV